MRTTLYRRALLGLATATLAAAACGNDANAPSPRFAAGVAPFSGDAQTDLPGNTLADPLVVKVFDDQGQPFAGASVTWAIISGGGVLSNTTTTTDATGQAHATLTLPAVATATDVKVGATVPDIQTVTFTETADPNFDPNASPSHH
jgi:hypothetical protein